MKKNYFFTLLLTFCFSFLGFSQTTVFQESFETGNSGTASETCNDNSGDFFTRTDGSDISSAYEVSGQDGSFYFAAMDTDGAPCTMAIQTLTFDDIDISSKSNLTLALLLAEDQPSDGKFDWDGGDLFYIEVDYDNSGTFTKVLQFATSATSGFNISAPMQDTNLDGIGDGQALSAVFSEFTLSLGTGNLVDVRLVFDGLGAGDEDIAVDNIRIIDGFVATPSIVITSPTNNQTFAPTTAVPFNMSIDNFTISGDNGSGMGDNTGDGYIKGTLEEQGGTTININFFTSDLVQIDVVPGKTYTATVELVDNNGASLSPAQSSTATFSVGSYIQVTDLASLRAGTEDLFYEVTGQVVMTYDAGGSRNQKYIQDDSAAILIDDTAGVITTTYNVGDAGSGLKGKLGSFNGVMQFIPTEDPGTPDVTGQSFTTTTVTMNEFITNFEDYESEWVKIQSASFDDADGTATFDSGTTKNYGVTEGSDTAVMRLQFGSTDIEGITIPQGSNSITGIAAQFNSTIQIFPTEIAGIALGVAKNEILGFATYPNPVTNKTFTISSNSSDTKQVTIFNVLGKKVFTTRFSATKKDIDVSNMNSGIYILKVTKNGKTATKKLVIR